MSGECFVFLARVNVRARTMHMFFTSEDWFDFHARNPCSTPSLLRSSPSTSAGKVKLYALKASLLCGSGGHPVCSVSAPSSRKVVVFSRKHEMMSKISLAQQNTFAYKIITSAYLQH